MFVVVFLALAVIGASIQLMLDRQPRTPASVLNVSLAWWLGLGIGGSGLFAASGHLFAADEVAESIGWAPGSPFQREVGFANLAIATIAILSVWIRGTFREATVIATSMYLLGASVGHVIEIVNTGNSAEYNAGPILYTNIIGPLVAIGLLVALRRAQHHQSADGHAAAQLAHADD